MSEAEPYTVTAEGVTVHVSEKVSTGEYETAQVSASLEASVEGVDMTKSVPDNVRRRLYALERELQGIVEAAAEERRCG